MCEESWSDIQKLVRSSVGSREGATVMTCISGRQCWWLPEIKLEKRDTTENRWPKWMRGCSGGPKAVIDAPEILE